MRSLANNQQKDKKTTINEELIPAYFGPGGRVIDYETFEKMFRELIRDSFAL